MEYERTKEQTENCLKDSLKILKSLVEEEKNTITEYMKGGEININKRFEHDIKILAFTESIHAIEKVQELAQAQTEGRLWELPFKLGDMVYRYFHFATTIGTVIYAENSIEDGKVISVFKNDRENPLFCPCGFVVDFPTKIATYRMDALGKSVFLTREAALKALEGG